MAFAIHILLTKYLIRDKRKEEMTESKSTAKALRRLANENEAARAMLGWLSEGKRNTETTDVDVAEREGMKWGIANIEEEFMLTRADVIWVMRELQALQLGRFITGRKGWESRFEWWSNRVQVGLAAMGKVETIAIDEDALDISEEDLIESHRMLIAHALGRPVSAVKIKVKPEAA